LYDAVKSFNDEVVANDDVILFKLDVVTNDDVKSLTILFIAV